jgi:hypothetical protein
MTVIGSALAAAAALTPQLGLSGGGHRNRVRFGGHENSFGILALLLLVHGPTLYPTTC